METLQEPKLESFINMHLCKIYDKEDLLYNLMKFIYQYVFYYLEMSKDIKLNKREATYKHKYPEAPYKFPHPVEILALKTMQEKSRGSHTLLSIEEGGYSYEVMKQLFNKIGIRSVRKNYIYPYTNKRKEKIQNSEEVFEYNEADYKALNTNIEKFIEQNRIEMAILTLIEATDEYDHSIACVKCEEEYYIIDSDNKKGLAKPIPCDWRNLHNIYTNEYLRSYYTKKYLKKFGLRFEMDFYYSRATLKQPNACNLIKEKYIH